MRPCKRTFFLRAATRWSQSIRAGAGYLSSLSKPEQVQANVSTVAGFTVAATPTSLSTAVGGFVSSVVTVTPVNGFNAYVSLSCTGLPVNTTCTFTPLNVPASCTTNASGVQTCTPGTSVMQIQTLAPSPGRSGATAVANAGMQRYAFIFPALFGLAGLGACKRRAWRNLALGMLAFAGAMGMTACSQRYNYLNHGPPGNPGTPTGNYTVTVEAQSSTGSLTTTPPTQPQLTLTITAKARPLARLRNSQQYGLAWSCRCAGRSLPKRSRASGEESPNSAGQCAG